MAKFNIKQTDWQTALNNTYITKDISCAQFLKNADLKVYYSNSDFKQNNLTTFMKKEHSLVYNYLSKYVCQGGIGSTYLKSNLETSLIKDSHYDSLLIVDDKCRGTSMGMKSDIIALLIWDYKMNCNIDEPDFKNLLPSVQINLICVNADRKFELMNMNKRNSGIFNILMRTMPVAARNVGYSSISLVTAQNDQPTDCILKFIADKEKQIYVKSDKKWITVNDQMLTQTRYNKLIKHGYTPESIRDMMLKIKTFVTNNPNEMFVVPTEYGYNANKALLCLYHTYGYQEYYKLALPNNSCFDDCERMNSMILLLTNEYINIIQKDDWRTKLTENGFIRTPPNLCTSDDCQELRWWKNGYGYCYTENNSKFSRGRIMTNPKPCEQKQGLLIPNESVCKSKQLNKLLIHSSKLNELYVDLVEYNIQKYDSSTLKRQFDNAEILWNKLKNTKTNTLERDNAFEDRENKYELYKEVKDELNATKKRISDYEEANPEIKEEIKIYKSMFGKAKSLINKKVYGYNSYDDEDKVIPYTHHNVEANSLFAFDKLQKSELVPYKSSDTDSEDSEVENFKDFIKKQKTNSKKKKTNSKKIQSNNENIQVNKNDGSVTRSKTRSMTRSMTRS